MSFRITFWIVCLVIALLIVVLHLLSLQHDKQVFRVKRSHLVVLGVLLVVALHLRSSYTTSQARNALSRMEAALTATLPDNRPITLAAVWPEGDEDFLDGARLAVAEINAHGGVQFRDADRQPRRRELRLAEFHETPDGSDGIYRDIARNTDIFAVIGHRYAEAAVPAAIAYQYSGVLYVAPAATNVGVTRAGITTVIRTVPRDLEFASAMMRLCVRNGWRRLVLVYPQTAFGSGFAHSLGDELADANNRQSERDQRLGIAFSRSYPVSQNDFQQLISDIQENRFDAILVADTLPRAGGFIRQLRERGVEQPVLGSVVLDTPDLWRLASAKVRNVYLASIYPAALQSLGGEMAQSFITGFQRKYGREPSQYAAQGYESVRIVVQGWEKAGTPLASAASIALKANPGWQGLTGRYDFSPAGEVIERPIFIKRSDDGHFIDVAD